MHKYVLKESRRGFCCVASCRPRRFNSPSRRFCSTNDICSRSYEQTAVVKCVCAGRSVCLRRLARSGLATYSGCFARALCRRKGQQNCTPPLAISSVRTKIISYSTQKSHHQNEMRMLHYAAVSAEVLACAACYDLNPLQVHRHRYPLLAIHHQFVVSLFRFLWYSVCFELAWS